ncbi:MAG TPA: CHAT domain-containing protein [Thermoanaerobaculia bacterium]|jgi:CHAT domain-containing protein/predicted negative regulator of RcsB-dependent stress response|nr:CHAT domain-containing protein [Thermoanaerobaculia bacterium]
MGRFHFRLLACLALLAAGSPAAAKDLRFQPGRACKLTAGVVDVYSFALKKGDFQELVFDQQGVDIEVEVLDPRGRKVVTVDSMNATQGPEDVSWVASSTGKYQVRVSGEAGTYVTRTARHRQAMPQDRDRAAAAVAYSQGQELKGSHKAEARAKFQDAARLAGEAKDRLREADALNQLGDLQCAGHLWADCHDSCSRALSIYESLGQRVQLSPVLTHLATALQGLGDSERAVATYERSIRLAHELGNDSHEALARAGLGRLQLDTDKIDQALVNLEEAAKLYHRQPNLLEEAKVLISCGRAYSKLGELDRALGAQESALKELSQGKDTFWIAWALSHLGDTYREAGQNEPAISYYLRALKSFHRQGFPEYEAGTSNQLGLAYYRLKIYSEAKNAFLRAVKIFQDRHMRVEEANAWINLGFVDVSLNSIPKAIDSLERALTINQQQKRLDTEASSYFGLAWAERRRNSPAAARANAARAIKALESLRSANEEPEVRALLLGHWQQAYELQVELLMEQHRLEPAAGHDVEAFDVSEQARARTLLESLGERAFPKPLRLRQVQQQVVDQDTVLLQYSLGNERSYLWVVTPQEYSTFDLPGRAQIAPLAREVHDLLSHSHRRQDQKRAVRQARALSRILLGPVARRLGNKRLLIVTPPELQYIPFATLPDLTAEGPPEPDDRWPLPLVVHHEIVSAPSSSVIAALRARARRPEPPNLLALVADPIYELNGARPLAGRFESLPSSRDEAETIASLARGETVLKLYDFRANREEVMDQLGAYRILHFAVHGDPNKNNPGLSALVLSAFDRKGQPRDPFLRARDIQYLGLPADLAVLSACGTGLGMEVRGEGLLGLTQAFLSAGTSSVVVSLWDVDDLATKKLMSSFYSRLLKRGWRPSAALREAQIEMWRQPQWNAPSYWAGFIEQGEWR